MGGYVFVKNFPLRQTVMVFVLACGVFLFGCEPGLTYRMVAPQVSPDNKYIGPDLEVQFRFGKESIQLDILNTSPSSVYVDWNKVVFVRLDSHVVKLVPVGIVPLPEIPPGASVSVSLRPIRYDPPPPTLWHRRDPLRKRIVYPVFLQKSSNRIVRVRLPVKKVDLETRSYVTETYEFAFKVEAVK